jgi:hypothetical protein
MDKWFQVSDERKIQVYSNISDDIKLPAYAIEKDWWVVQTLAIIFEMEIGKYLVFKGGTSLSKAWDLIERFSEDIDMAVDRSFLGFDGELTRKKEITKLRKESNKYITEKFFPELEARFIEKGLEGVKLALVDAKDSDQDPRIIEIYYPNVIPSPGYIQPRVQVEIGCRSLKEPFTVRSFNSLLDQTYPDTPFFQKRLVFQLLTLSVHCLRKFFCYTKSFRDHSEKLGWSV